MASRTGEKVGWTGGWLGAFLWVFILSVVFLVQQRWIQGLLGLFLFFVAVALIILLSPWKRPATPLWKLMLPTCLIVIISVVWAVRAYGGVQETGLSWWSFFWVFPLLIPIGTVGRRTWNDGEIKPGASTEGDKSDR